MVELERVVANLETELDAANRARTELQGGLDNANSEIEKRQFELERLKDELEKATNLSQRCRSSRSRRGFCFGAVRCLEAAIDPGSGYDLV